MKPFCFNPILLYQEAVFYFKSPRWRLPESPSLHSNPANSLILVLSRFKIRLYPNFLPYCQALLHTRSCHPMTVHTLKPCCYSQVRRVTLVELSELLLLGERGRERERLLFVSISVPTSTNLLTNCLVQRCKACFWWGTFAYLSLCFD